MLFVAPDVADQTLIAVIDPDAHPVPILSVLVTPVAVALPEYVCVIAVVGVPHTVSVVVAPASDRFVVVVLNAEKVAHHTTDVVNVGDVPNTTTPVPVSSLRDQANLALVLIPAKPISLTRKFVPL